MKPLQDTVEETNVLLKAVLGQELEPVSVPGLGPNQSLILTYRDSRGENQQSVLSLDESGCVQVFSTGELPATVLALDGLPNNDIDWTEESLKMRASGIIPALLES